MYLVTGSSGHLGEALMRLGAARDLPMRGTDLRPGPMTAITGDLTNPRFADRAAEGARVILHCATLHKPHVATHPRQAFVDVNITATLNLLEAAKRLQIPLVFCSTTSAFGAALTPPRGAPAAWITEDVPSVPKNIYGATKTGAEDLCHLFARRLDVPVIVLRLARFFPEPDDDPDKRAAWADDNLKLNELTYRRAAVEDMAEAVLCAVRAAPTLGFGRYIVSGPTPFRPEDCSALRHDAPAVLEARLPGTAAKLARLGWRFAPGLDRVYDSRRAQTDLGWTPRDSFASVLDRIVAGGQFAGPLAQAMGIKGYHGAAFADGLYPVEG